MAFPQEKKEKTTNLVVGKSFFKPPTKERNDLQMPSSPLRFTLTSVMFSYIFSCRKRTKYNWDEKASQARRKKERVRNQEQFSEVTSAIRLSQTWCSHSLLLTSVWLPLNSGEKNCVCLYAHTTLSCEKGLLQLGKKIYYSKLLSRKSNCQKCTCIY